MTLPFMWCPAKPPTMLSATARCFFAQNEASASSLVFPMSIFRSPAARSFYSTRVIGASGNTTISCPDLSWVL